MEEAAGAQGAARAADASERELRAAVSGWVAEHRRRAEELRRGLTATLLGAGFAPPSRGASRA